MLHSRNAFGVHVAAQECVVISEPGQAADVVRLLWVLLYGVYVLKVKDAYQLLIACVEKHATPTRITPSTHKAHKQALDVQTALRPVGLVACRWAILLTSSGQLLSGVGECSALNDVAVAQLVKLLSIAGIPDAG